MGRVSLRNFGDELKLYLTKQRLFSVLPEQLMRSSMRFPRAWSRCLPRIKLDLNSEIVYLYTKDKP